MSHPEEDRVLGEKWFVVVNDLVGGWSIANVDKPLSEMNFHSGGEREVGDFWSKEIAEHIVKMHNIYLSDRAHFARVREDVVRDRAEKVYRREYREFGVDL
jgi:hypothetical protein